MKYKEYAPVRLSHLLHHCSVGSIIRSSEYLLTVKDTSYWTDGEGNFTGRLIPYVEQVKKSLGIDKQLREPPIGRLNHEGEFDHQSGYYIQAKVFPSWFVCSNSKCGRLYKDAHKSVPVDLFGESSKKPILTCQKCQSKLDQVNLVQIDERGFMSDVPWYRIAHAEQSFCNWAVAELKWDVSNNQVRCSCGASAKLGLESRRYYQGYEQPWLSRKVDEKKYETEPEQKSRTALILQVNDTRVHTPINRSALVIPPESRVARGTLVDKLYRHPKRELLMSAIEAGQDCQSLQSQLRHEFECNKIALEEAILDIKNGYPMFREVLQERELSELEYEALIRPLDFDDDEDFVTRHFSDEFNTLISQIKDPVVNKIGSLVDKVVAVNKLKEILVFTGFTRGSGELKVSKTDDFGDDKDEIVKKDNYVVPPDLGQGLDWLPALELYGEGIFININHEILKKWECHSKVEKRFNILMERYQKSNLASSARFQKELVLTPRFLWLHAFSHLLIKELESLAGYPAASLKEKIYHSSSADMPMSGILIYTTIADIDGTLGGLVELAEPKRLIKVLSRVYEHMQWCSLDPVCGSHTGQGPSLLNLAACHGCLLLPETSCAYGNILLDRILLKGDKELPSIFEYVISKG